MATFRYKALSAQGGERVRGDIEAPSRKLAVHQLRQAGQLPISVIASSGRPWFRLDALRARRPARKVSRQDVVLLTRGLATLLAAGLSLEQALRALAGFDLTAPARRLVQSLTGQLQGGVSLSAALVQHPAVFDGLYVSMVRAGEASGALDKVVARLADYLERMAALRANLVNALIYPGILFGFSVLSVLALMTFVIPQFVPLFENANQDLPWLTRGVFAGSALFQAYWWCLPPGLLLLVWGVDNYLADIKRRRRFDVWCLRLPWLGALVRQVEIARCAHTLGTALSHGVPLLTGIALVREATVNTRMAEALDAVSISLEQGQSMAAPLKASQLWPAPATQLIEIGEASGQLEPMLARLADIYDREVQSGIKRLLTVLEPLLILGLGGLVATIIASVLLAVMGLNALVI
ncbi:MAG: type II secretion system F family protein [Gammaproteobacteria bacterium]|nr:type II secretion system F family protein [Gammaproteobacteria bacterium]